MKLVNSALALLKACQDTRVDTRNRDTTTLNNKMSWVRILKCRRLIMSYSPIDGEPSQGGLRIKSVRALVQISQG